MAAPLPCITESRRAHIQPIARPSVRRSALGMGLIPCASACGGCPLPLGPPYASGCAPPAAEARLPTSSRRKSTGIDGFVCTLFFMTLFSPFEGSLFLDPLPFAHTVFLPWRHTRLRLRGAATTGPPPRAEGASGAAALRPEAPRLVGASIMEGRGAPAPLAPQWERRRGRAHGRAGGAWLEAARTRLGTPPYGHCHVMRLTAPSRDTRHLVS
ncbi:MAG: hypothetical protein J3K34DRAFT_414887 [Monoraphidium minutum]|nr:MAG: hypothetical protein J3K34DRAFT_414887 [Monoraphidium minutum]